MGIQYGYEGTGAGVETAARYEHRKRARPAAASVLRDWYTGNYRQIANTKPGRIDQNGFENIVSEFAPQLESLKPLARELRNVLFQIRDGATFTGTFRDNDIIHEGIINAFGRAIGQRGTGNRMGEARPGYQYCEAFFGGGKGFAAKGLRKTIQYNDTRAANERTTYCIIHESLPVKTMRLMSAPDNILCIFLCSFTHLHLISPSSLCLECRFPRPYLSPRYDWPSEG
jgi:hypothetical protein